MSKHLVRRGPAPSPAARRTSYGVSGKSITRETRAYTAEYTRDLSFPPRARLWREFVGAQALAVYPRVQANRGGCCFAGPAIPLAGANVCSIIPSAYTVHNCAPEIYGRITEVRAREGIVNVSTFRKVNRVASCCQIPERKILLRRIRPETCDVAKYRNMLAAPSRPEQ
ncbi:hypothetical protein Trydic_g23686 [Trypoxylus dichotomus]